MLPLYGLPVLPEIRSELKGYSVGLLALYITHKVGTVVSLKYYNYYSGKRPSGTLVIIYPLLCNVSLNIRVKQKALAAYAGPVIKHKQYSLALAKVRLWPYLCT